MYSKLTSEVTYSWKIFLKIMDLMISKILRDLTMNQQREEEEDYEDDEEEEEEESPQIHSAEDIKLKNKKREKKRTPKKAEFTVDEDFFHSVIMPSIYSAVISSLKQENSYLFHMLFALEIAHKKTVVSIEEKEFFLEKFFSIPDCNKWRDTDHSFIERD